MRLKILGSSSAGNCYILEASNGESLIIECGVHFAKVKQALNFDLSKVSGLLVSHSHGDHSKSMKDALSSAIHVYSGIETFVAKGLQNHHRAKVIEAEKIYNVGSFKIKPLDVHHDVPCFCFMIKHSEMGLCVFITDTFYSDYVFKGVNHFIVEANHSQDIIKTNDTPSFLRDRIIQSHMNLETLKEMLLKTDLSEVATITIIHLSDGNSDAKRFKREVEEQTGKAVHVAERGMVIENFHQTPF